MKAARQIAMLMGFVAAAGIAWPGTAAAVNGWGVTEVDVEPSSGLNLQVSNGTITGDRKITVKVSHAPLANSPSCHKVQNIYVYGPDGAQIGNAAIKTPGGLCSFDENSYTPSFVAVAPNDKAINDMCRNQPAGKVTAASYVYVNFDAGSNMAGYAYFPVTVTCGGAAQGSSPTPSGASSGSAGKTPPWGKGAVPQKGGQANPMTSVNTGNMKLNSTQVAAVEQNNKINWNNKGLDTAGNYPGLHKPDGVPTTGPKLEPVRCTWEKVDNNKSHVLIWNQTQSVIMAGSKVSFTLNDGKSSNNLLASLQQKLLPSGSEEVANSVKLPPAGSSCVITSTNLITSLTPPVKPEGMNANTGKPPKKSDLLQDVMH